MKKGNLPLAVIAGLCSFGTLAAHAQTSCISPPLGLVSWWRGQGNAFDSAGPNDGQIVDGITFTNAMAGDGFVFSGSGDDYVRLPPNLFPVPSDGQGGAPFSFEVWFNTSAGGVILGQQDATPFDSPLLGYVPALYVGTNGLLHAEFFWGTDAQLISDVSVNDGRFHHVAVTYDGSVEVLYLDGVAITSTPFTQAAYAPVCQYQLGTGFTGGWPATPGGWFPFAGVIDEPSLYNRALMASEVSAVFSAGTKGKCGGPVLRQRYSFDEPVGSRTVTESRRGANGALLFVSAAPPYTNGTPDGSGFTGTGELKLQGNNGYVALPQGLVSWLSAATFEAWVTWNGPSTSVWQRIFDFGFSDQGTNVPGIGTNYVILCPSRGGTDVLGFEETTVNPFGSELDPEALILYGPTQLPIGQKSYLAVTYDPANGLSQLFLNGALISSVSSRALNPLSEIADYNCWLGRSQWERDPFFNGQYDEFRIWEGVLSPQDIAGHFVAGPDQQFAEPIPPMLRIAISDGKVFLSWPEKDSAGFRLESSPSPTSNDWIVVGDSPTLSNGVYRLSLSVSAVAEFYRLRK